MGVLALSKTAVLVPELVRIMHAEIGPKACRKRGIGDLRRRLEGVADAMPTSRILAEICRHCPLACDLARRE